MLDRKLEDGGEGIVRVVGGDSMVAVLRDSVDLEGTIGSASACAVAM